VSRERPKRALIAASCNVLEHHTLQLAAALCYYLVLFVFPGLIFLSALMLSALMGAIPLPGLFGRGLAAMSLLLLADTMRVVQAVLVEVLATNRTAWLSFSMLGTIWLASAAFAAITEALDIAYGVVDDRPFWKTRLRATGLGVVTAGLASPALAVMIVGPRFGALAGKQDLPLCGFCIALAHHPLGGCHCVYPGGRRTAVFSRAQCAATFLGDVAGSNFRDGVLAGTFLFAGVLFPSRCRA
jgi:uncharacterized BrkB/YihY/UPF0761 family membrane protein